MSAAEVQAVVCEQEQKYRLLDTITFQGFMANIDLVGKVASALELTRDIAQSVLDWHRRALSRRRVNDSSARLFGLEILEESPTDPQVDICFVHGLNGDRRSAWTWTGSEGEAEAEDDGVKEVFWPKDLLPKETRIRRSRVLTYGYDTKFPSSEYLTRRTLYHQARDLLNELALVRNSEDTRKRPIIFVGHTLGGIVIQAAFILSSASEQDDLRSICLSTAGVVFLNTPFRGLSDNEWAETFSSIVKSTASIGPTLLDDITKNLHNDARVLRNMLEPFTAAISGVEIRGFEAGHSDGLLSVRGKVRDYRIEQLSTDLAGLGHIRGRSDRNYKKIVSAIDEICQRMKTTDNWLKYEARQDLSQTLPLSILDTTPDIPTPDPSFVGRGRELNELREKLISSPIHREGWDSITYVIGKRGIGKTQLVLKYAERYKFDYSSIFWVSAESRRAIESGFLTIGKQLLEHYSSFFQTFGMSPDVATSKAAGVLGLQKILEAPQGDSESPSHIYRLTHVVSNAVIEWFNHINNSNWLLIIDGLDVGDSEMANCLQVIPTNKCNHGRVVITRRHPWSSVGDKVITVRAVEPKDSEQILTALAGKPRRTRDIGRILDTCDGNPLLLATLARQIASTGLTFGEYDRAFEQEKVKLSQQEHISPPALRDSQVYESVFHNIVRKSWTSKVSDLPTLQATLLACCSVFPGSNIPVKLFSSQPQVFGKISSKDVEHGMDDLTQSNLITRRKGLGDLIVDRIVARWYLNEHLAPEKMVVATKYAWQCIASFASEAVKSLPSEASASVAQKELASLVEDYTSEKNEKDLSELPLSTKDFVIVAELCRRRGRDTTSERWCDSARQKLLREATMSRVPMALLEIYLNIRETAKAQMLWDTVIIPRRSKRSTTNKAFESQKLVEIRVKFQLGKTEEAIEGARSLVLMLDTKEGSLDVVTLTALNDLVAFLIQKGKYDTAEPVLRRLVLSYESVYGLADPLTIEALDTLGSLFMAEDNLHEAENAFLQAKWRNGQRLGRDHPVTQACNVKLAKVFARQGRHDKALELYDEAIKVLERWYGTSHPDIVKIRISRAESRMAERSFALATEDYGEALKAVGSNKFRTYSQASDKDTKELTEQLQSARKQSKLKGDDGARSTSW